MSTVRPPALLVASYVSFTLGCADPGAQGEEADGMRLGEESAPATASIDGDAVLDAPAPRDATPVSIAPIVEAVEAVEAVEDGASEQTPKDGEASACATWYRDCDGDGYAASEDGSVVACDAPAAVDGCAFTARAPAEGAIDCDDTSAAHHPGASYGLAIDDAREGLSVLLCRPDGTYAGGTDDRRCVVTEQADLDCDGKLDADPAGGPFCLSSGHCIATVTHACNGADDCDCYEGPLACGIHEGTAVLCAPDGTSQAFTGTIATLCR